MLYGNIRWACLIFIFYWFILLFMFWDFLCFIFGSNNPIFYFWIFINLYLPLFFSLVLFFDLFIFEKYDARFLFLCFLFILLILELVFFFGVWFYGSFSVDVIKFGNLYVWSSSISFNKIVILLCAIFICSFMYSFDYYFFYRTENLSLTWVNCIPDKSYANIFDDVKILRFQILFLFIAVFCFILTLFTFDLFLTAIYFEVSTVCLVFLFFFYGFKSKEAIVKFFIYSALMSLFFFLDWV